MRIATSNIEGLAYCAPPVIVLGVIWNVGT